MDTRAVLARFQTERQVLALMDHPNIARVFDAGATPTGRPYFVMELVRGVPITEYCDQSRLSIAERLTLFIQVCHAIQHAHHQGIIHRDIKPSNVLVTLHDGKPHVKVIDFGIAKATQGRLTDQTALTMLEHFIGTPAYVSPEQTEPGGLQVDTRSDLYSLGALLYELLTGCTPFESEDLLSAGLDRMKQRIREEEPPTPSKRLSALNDEQITGTVARRQVNNAARLSKQLHGDLDWIVMRCLEKDRTRRYPSAHDLAADLQRYLQNEPINARPPSLRYTLSKWTRRHRLIVASAALIFTVLLVATLVSTAMAIRATHAEQVALQAKQQAQQERHGAEKVSNFMLSVFTAADPFENHGKQMTASELLDQAGRSIKSDLNEQPEVRARLLEAIGRAYRRQDQPSRAVKYLEDSLRIRQQHSADDPQIGSALTELAIALRDDGKFDASNRAFQQALKISERSTGTRSKTYARLLVDLGRMEIARGDVLKTESYLTRGLALTRELEGPRHPEAASILTDLSSARTWRNDLDGAEQAALEAVSIYRESVPELHPDRVMADFQLGQVLYLKQQMPEAGALFERTLVAQRVLFGNLSSNVADTLDSLAKVRLAQNRTIEAEKLTREALDSNIGSRGQDHFSTGYLRMSLAQILMRQKRYTEEKLELHTALNVFEKTLPPDHMYVASAEYFLGEAQLGISDFLGAEAILTSSVTRFKRLEPPSWRIARSTSALGEAIYRQGRIREAEQPLIDGYRATRLGSGADALTQQSALDRISRYYIDQGQVKKLNELASSVKEKNVIRQNTAVRSTEFSDARPFIGAR
jgi:serine/threonine protein kinase